MTPRDLMLADSLVLRTQELIDWFQPRCYLGENPSGSQLWQRFTWPRLVKTSYCSYAFPYKKNTTLGTNTDLCLRDPCGGAGVCGQMRGTQHLQHAQRGGGGVSNKYHTRGELHRVPEGLCHNVVLRCERGQMAPLGIY